MQLVLPLGRSALYAALGLTAGSAAALSLTPLAAWPLGIFGLLSLVGLYDVTQRRRTLNRNYPILIHFRYFLESIGPEIRQYFIESDTDERPFSREQRSIVYQRAKNVLDKRPFGTLLDVYVEKYEWINHSLTPSRPDTEGFRLTVGEGRARPYSASVFNISAMSFGSLSAHAIRALNAGAARGGFYHDTGEGSISRYHREAGGDLVWEIGSGYFGCRNADGSFCASRFADTAADAQVKMIEIKLSQGAKPGHGGVLPGCKVTPEIAEARGVPVGQDVVSPPAHSAFSTPRGLLDFVDQLRELSGGKPVGFKLAIGHPWEWFAIARAMLESGQHPDFIVVDGAEGGTGAAPLEFTNRVGTPLTEALLLVHNTLVGTGLRESVRVAAAGKITSAFHILRHLALGADWCNAARGFMFSLGCIQARSCHTGRCPSGVATQNPRRGNSIDVADKTARVHHYHANTLKALAELIGSAGLNHPDEVGPEHVMRRLSPTDVCSFEEIYPFLQPGVLRDGTAEPEVFRRFWHKARSDSFSPPTDMLEKRRSKLY